MNTLFLLLFLMLPVFTGMTIALVAGSKNTRGRKLLLSFGGAFLLGISFLHLIPEIYISSGPSVGLFILTGFLVQLLLEFFSQGIEHGHSHTHDHSHGFPFMIFLSLCIHAFIEALPLDNATLHEDHHHNGIALLTGIAMHNIPLTIALTTTLLCYHVKTMRTILWVTIFACCGPAGALFGRYYHDSFTAISPAFFDYAMGLVIGMFLHISTTILFETSEGHRFNALKLATVITGFIVAFISSAI